jgi:hypothetical protein
MNLTLLALVLGFGFVAWRREIFLDPDVEAIWSVTIFGALFSAFVWAVLIGAEWAFYLQPYRVLVRIYSI